MEQLKAQQNREGPEPSAGSGEGSRRRAETPFQAMLRMLEDAAEQQGGPPRAQPGRAVPVAPAELPAPGEDEGGHGGDMADHHLQSAITDRHVAHLEHRGQNIEEVMAQRAREKVPTAEQQIAALSPLQRAVVMAEVLGEPRYKRRGPPYSARY